MSTKYQCSAEVPNGAIIKRLKELSDAVISGKESTSREFTMRIPAELDRDPDLVLSIAATRLEYLDKVLNAARKSIANPSWAGICDEDVMLEQSISEYDSFVKQKCD